MDGLAETEIEGIWTRIKRYINLDEVTAGDPTNQKEQLKRAMSIKTYGDGKTAQGNMDFLIKRGFPKQAIKNRQIQSELMQSVKNDYISKVKENFTVVSEKEITIKSGRLKGYKYIQFRGMKKGQKRNVIAGRLYIKKK